MSRPIPAGPVLTRRGLLAAGGLLVTVALAPRAFADAGGEGGAGPAVLRPELPGSLKSTPGLAAWIHIDAAGRATVFSGKAELGQGIRGALLQVVAEALDMPPPAITLVSADTGRVPDEGLTAGSHSMQDGGTALLIAGANVRMLLMREAARQLALPEAGVETTGRGVVAAKDGRVLGYGPLAAALSLEVEAVANPPLRAPASYRSMGRDIPRPDIPAKLTGGEAFVQDLRLPGMLHARLVRGPSYGTSLTAPDMAAARAAPGVAGVVERGGFRAVVADTEWQAITAMRLAQRSASRRDLGPLPAGQGPDVLRAMPSRRINVEGLPGASSRGGPRRLVSNYSRPWLSHGSIGPSCAVALLKDGALTLWSHSQGVFDMQRATAELVGLPPERVRVIHTPSAGCYGQNGADDVTAEAGLIAMAFPGRPVRLQWMREQEFGWEPCGCGMTTRLEASLDAAGHIASWKHEVWSNAHNNRATDASGYLAAHELDPALAWPEQKPIPMPEGDGDRNANPLYAFANMEVRYRFVPEPVLRASALRSLGGHLNVFSIESMLDELAALAGTDPLAFRLAHMDDPRARDVMIAATDRFGWARRPRGNGRRGCGMGFARYKNLGAYCAVAMEVEVTPETGAVSVLRVEAAVDAGQPASPDGIRNQVEGGIVQSLSWALREAVTFDSEKRTSFDWGSYPILRFADVPGSVSVHVLARPGQPFLGAGETAQGPASAALANAIADATGLRLRHMPFTPARVKSALGPLYPG
ncbi:molybdopterin cofactor-binding domain-containing protein [Oceanicella sp. SM1341]|uniref:xanthine dehydrogenase family protein molybdopterin-binding subunit n=1 Tax=Oceanicella sp. SM1341 TaxID=1548889 RepID=UPI000E4F2CEC|nr:molybdopterin cofactor-binding domain-containing protein [Oceanicella sp. SM1341]